ncbi:MAG: hypothetical protein OXE83_12980 [Gammaproteobacteria bacterium]|nr:hypothetical protein [Gammaproteobacteria bacterium]
MADDQDIGADLGIGAGDAAEPALGGQLIQDAALILAGLALFGGAEAWAAASGLLLAQVVAVGNALVAGWVITNVLHEWGHYAGAKLARAAAPRVKPPGLSFFRYRFDLEGNSLAQFTAMSLGGNLAHWGVFAAAFLLLPMATATPAQSGFVAATFAFAVFASVIEWPIIVRTNWGGLQPSKAFAHINRTFIRGRYLVGGIGGVVFLVVA